MILTDPTGLIIDTQGDDRVIDAGRSIHLDMEALERGRALAPTPSAAVSGIETCSRWIDRPASMTLSSPWVSIINPVGSVRIMIEFASLRNVFEFSSAQRAAWRSEAVLGAVTKSSASATSGARAQVDRDRWFLDLCHDAATDDLKSDDKAPRSTNLSTRPALLVGPSRLLRGDKFETRNRAS